MSESIWNTLSQIDCSDHIEQKGKFSYLAWTWAWAKVKEVYPDADYKLLKDKHFADETMEVRVRVTIASLSHTMWLPVLDYQNKPIPSPNAFDINTARMRCLVKCLAMFGLGHYIYAGESAPAPAPVQQEKYDELVALVSGNKVWELRDFYEVNSDHMDNIFNMAPDGHKTAFKNDVRRVYGEGSKAVKEAVAAFEGFVGEGAPADQITEAWEEMCEGEKKYVLKGMNEILRHQVGEAIGGFDV